MKAFNQLREEFTRRIMKKLINESAMHDDDPTTRATVDFINVLPHVEPKHRKHYVKEYNRISNIFFDHDLDDLANHRLHDAYDDMHELTGRMMRRAGVANTKDTGLSKLTNHSDPLHRLMGDRFHGNIQSSIEDEDHGALNKDIDALHSYIRQHDIK